VSGEGLDTCPAKPTIPPRLRNRLGQPLARAVRWDTTEWQGAAADAYRTWTSEQKDAVAALAGAAETMAAITEGAGMLVAGVRMMVRDAIAVLVSRLITYAAEEVFSFRLVTPLVVEQVSTLCASWGARIAKWLPGLVTSLEHLRGLTGKLGDAIEAIKSCSPASATATLPPSTGSRSAEPDRPRCSTMNRLVTSRRSTASTSRT
jgi:uncharacterized protein YukE